MEEAALIRIGSVASPIGRAVVMRHPIVMEAGPVVEERPVGMETLVWPAGTGGTCTHLHMVLK